MVAPCNVFKSGGRSRRAVVPTAEDQNKQDCPLWARKGECGKNPEFLG
jgi:hypothetical protein